VDDTREAPALRFIKLAESAGYRVKAYDPLVKKFESQLYSLEEDDEGYQTVKRYAATWLMK
jgi:UDP-N-acetyl-D-mannosaminuronate dehydrogenase